MSSPKYTNFFIINRNDNFTEVSIDFKLQFMGNTVEVSEEKKQINIVPAVGLEDVASVMLNLDAAINLKTQLDNLLKDVYIPNSNPNVNPEKK